MEKILFKCPECKSEISIDEKDIEKLSFCPHCSAKIQVISSDEENNNHEDNIQNDYLNIDNADIGIYHLEKLLGEGATGKVWLATNKQTNQQVALKLINPAFTQDEDSRKRFQHEIMLGSKLRRPEIVTAFDAGIAKDICYLAMEYIDGDELSVVIERDHCMEEKKALQIVLDVAEALEQPWKNLQLFHRDIKPSNIMISKDGKTKVMDMGIAKSVLDNNSITRTGTSMGTPKYMSPEQIRVKEQLDFRTDIFSLGATLYHMLTGNPPFNGDGPINTANSVLKDKYPNPKDYNSNISDNCVELLKIMLAKNKDNRPDSWKALIKDINRVMNGVEPISKMSQEEKSEEYAKLKKEKDEKRKHLSEKEKYKKNIDNDIKLKDIIIAVVIVIILILIAMYYAGV